LRLVSESIRFRRAAADRSARGLAVVSAISPFIQPAIIQPATPYLGVFPGLASPLMTRRENFDIEYSSDERAENGSDNSFLESA
jgi:hypothetical protein